MSPDKAHYVNQQKKDTLERSQASAKPVENHEESCSSIPECYIVSFHCGHCGAVGCYSVARYPGFTLVCPFCTALQAPTGIRTWHKSGELRDVDTPAPAP